MMRRELLAGGITLAAAGLSIPSVMAAASPAKPTGMDA